MKTITIEGQLRTEYGKSATRQLRSQELVPGVIYGGAQEVSFVASAKALKPLVYTPSFQLAEVNVDGTTYRCILKDLQFDKVSDELIHVDLLELVEEPASVRRVPVALPTISGHRLPGDGVARVDLDPAVLDQAGEVPDESLAADHVQAGSATGVATWTVAGADHTQGLGTAPDAWEQRVVAFLDDALAR